MFDHSAIMALARMIVETMTMFFYLLEAMTEDEWALRYAVLRLHDTAARIKLMRMSQSKADYDDLSQGRAELVKKIRLNPAFARLEPDQQDRLLTGEQIFVGGMRAAATRAAGWRGATFMALYNYFSAHVHAAPMSFLRMRQHGVDYYFPSEAQFGSASLAIEVAKACLRRVSLRYLDTMPSARGEFSAEYLTCLIKEDVECNVFTYGS
jgi:hypothetical protein